MKNNIPPVIAEWIVSLNDKSVPEHIKHNYASSLENVKDACETALKKYRSKR